MKKTVKPIRAGDKACISQGFCGHKVPMGTKMKVYHGSVFQVKTPEIRVSDRFLDFGHGFYVTSNIEQAHQWAIKTKSRNDKDKAFINSYFFNFEKAKKDLSILEFDGASKEWLEFICSNRSGNHNHSYDIVIGPVADDSVYQVVKLFELNVYDESETIKRLKVETFFNQILFHTEKSLEYLAYEAAVEVEL